jgi:hypothetical protein
MEEVKDDKENTNPTAISGGKKLPRRNGRYLGDD